MVGEGEKEEGRERTKEGGREREREERRKGGKKGEGSGHKVISIIIILDHIEVRVIVRLPYSRPHFT